MRAPIWIVAVVGLASVVSVGATSPDWLKRVPEKAHERINPLAEKPEAVAAGAILYKDHCQQCHQAHAEGDGHKKPSLRTERIRSVSDGDLEWLLRQGELSKGMPSWSSLPEAQRWQIIAYLRSIR